MCFKITLRTILCSFLLLVGLIVRAQLSSPDLVIYDDVIDHPIPIYLENDNGCSDLYFLTLNIELDTIRFKISQKNPDESLELGLKIGNIIFDSKNESRVAGPGEVNKVPYFNGELLSVEDGTTTIELVNNKDYNNPVAIAVLRVKPKGLIICKDTTAYSTIFNIEKKENSDTELFTSVLKYQCINSNWDRTNSIVSDVLSLNNIVTTIIINRRYYSYEEAYKEEYEGIDYDSIMESELSAFLEIINKKITLGQSLSEDEKMDISLFKETFSDGYYTNDSLLLKVSSIDELELELQKSNSLMNLEILDSLNIVQNIVLNYAPGYLYHKKKEITTINVIERPKYFFLKRYIYHYEIFGHNRRTNMDSLIVSDKWDVINLESNVLLSQVAIENYFKDMIPVKIIGDPNGTVKSINAIALIQRTFSKYGRVRILKPQSIYVSY